MYRDDEAARRLREEAIRDELARLDAETARLHHLAGKAASLRAELAANRCADPRWLPRWWLMVAVPAALLACAGVGWLALSRVRLGCGLTRTRLATANMKGLRDGAKLALALDEGCPKLATIADSRGADVDPWGSRYAVDCGRVVTIRSAGPDQRFGTEDDIAMTTRPMDTTSGGRRPKDSIRRRRSSPGRAR